MDEGVVVVLVSGGTVDDGGRGPTGVRPRGYGAAVVRTNGYAAISDYAAVGDGRTVALISRDGSVDWLCLPDLDSPSVFGALLDSERGGRFTLAPDAPFEVERCYRTDTNVLHTTFRTTSGTVRVTDAMLLPGEGLPPQRELVRRVDGLSGTVSMCWQATPRFGYGQRRTTIGRRSGVDVVTSGRDAVAITPWDAGESHPVGDGIGGRFEVSAGHTALLHLAAAHQQPLVLAGRDQVERRLEATSGFWRRWTGQRRYDGPWREAVNRSALALKLLVFAPSGAVAAAATTSLPEQLGGQRNWDYRYCWIRDSAFTLGALLGLGCAPEADAFFSWLLQASQLTKPRLQVLYRLNGGNRAVETTLPLAGYRGSRPVRVGNGAAGQRQLDIYGDLLQTAWMYHRSGRVLGSETGRRIAEIADLVCRIWRQPDSGIWEVRSEPVHFTHSKMMCWVALDRAARLADAGAIPARHVDRWRGQAAAIRDFIEGHCWSPTRHSYTRAAGVDELDAALLLGVLLGYDPPDHRRLAATVDAVQRDLGDGPLLYRYSGDDGLQGTEGAFLCCSFWLVDALARTGRAERAAGLMEQLLPLANDVGLYAEEITPDGEFLGNTPQALVHLALINAALSCQQGATR